MKITPKVILWVSIKMQGLYHSTSHISLRVSYNGFSGVKKDICLNPICSFSVRKSREITLFEL